MRLAKPIPLPITAFLVLALTSCALIRYEPTPPGPGVPRIANFRFEPASVRAGEVVEMSFDFEDSFGDIVEGYLVESGIREVRWTAGLEPIPLDMRGHKGNLFGTFRQKRVWDAEGIYIYEVYVVDAKGNRSNRLRARITVY
ncbi:MAG: hypothetical protein HY998_08625 [candidate division NC10 bacterium]|nr:hypothetical protein [candidate division NC10 bacterium]